MPFPKVPQINVIASFAVTMLAVHAQAQAPKMRQEIQAKAYHILSRASGDPEGAGEPKIIGRIPATPGMKIEVAAEEVTVEPSIALKGKCEVLVSVDGKTLATYEGWNLVLTPADKGADPLDYRKVTARMKELDAAMVRRDVAAIAGFFAKDAYIAVELLTKDGLETRKLNPQQLGEYLKSVFPTALKISGPAENHGPGQGNTPPDERPGTHLVVAADGMTAKGSSNVQYIVTLPEGPITWGLNRRIAMEVQGSAIVVTSFEIKIPHNVKEDWQNPKDNFSSPFRPRVRAIQPR